jgi:ubiquinone/menaquinone biosynthesis C-methylase UbiE
MSILSHRRSPESTRRFYNHIYRQYSYVEKRLAPVFDKIVAQKIETIRNVKTLSALDYGCGTGLLTHRLSSLFKTVTGKDQSEAMLSIAQKKGEETGSTALFVPGNLLAIDEPDNAVDWTFVSFALHLFPPDIEIEILKNLMRVSRRGVMIIDHNRRRTLLSSFIEWLEGSYYDAFIKINFATVAKQMKAALFEEAEIADVMVMTFLKAAPAPSAPLSTTYRSRLASRMTTTTRVEG